LISLRKELFPAPLSPSNPTRRSHKDTLRFTNTGRDPRRKLTRSTTIEALAANVITDPDGRSGFLAFKIGAAKPFLFYGGRAYCAA
jgi:hypothetical protein